MTAYEMRISDWSSDVCSADLRRITPDAVDARVSIERTPGAVEVIADTRFKNTPVQTIKDILAYVPGVISQTRMGDDARVSIRGSGLSRAYGTRGLAMYFDGIPLNTSAIGRAHV